MKLLVLALLSLILKVSTEDEVVASPSIEVGSALDQLPANSLYETLFSDYYNLQHEYIQKAPSKKPSKNKNSNKNQGESNKGGSYEQESKKKSNNYKYKFEYEDYNNYLKQYKGQKGEYDERIIGRKGLGFDKRSATSYGFRAPLTAEQLELVGYKYEKKEYKEKEIYPVIV